MLGLEEKLRALGKSVVMWTPASAVEAGSESAALREFATASFAATVGITGVDFALAETGTLVVTSHTEGSQLTSLAPPVHVALYRRSQLVSSLDEVLERLAVPRDPNLPLPGRSVVFITGTSRTADIEQILVCGVHGPREVHAVLVEDSCL
jgi:L-lactate dehydrogenase complex protein LldG